MTFKDTFNAAAAKVKRHKKKVLATIISVPLLFGVPRTVGTIWDGTKAVAGFGKDLVVDGAYGMYQHSTYEHIHYRGHDGKEYELKVLKSSRSQLEDAMDKFAGRQDDITGIFTEANKIDGSQERIDFLLKRLQKPNAPYFTK